MKLADLRVLLSAALLSCHGGGAPQPPDNHGTGSGSETTATASCKHEAPNITGCGGAEVVLPDGFAACKLPEEGDLPKATCDQFCAGFETRSCHSFSSNGKAEVYCDAANPCMGRLPSDRELARGTYADDVIAHLALARRMEARSVDAFHELASDLAKWGAPAALIAACHAAAAQEARHAEAIASLLRARGIELEDIARRPGDGFASLAELAHHNEREGVAGETWGALLASYQAEHAPDADVRDVMRAIAADETEHAALALAIAAWARTQLPAAELDATRRAAFAALDLRGPAPLGWPPAAAASAMRDTLATALA